MNINRTFSLPVSTAMKLKGERNQYRTVTKAVNKYLSDREDFSLKDVPIWSLMSQVADRTDDEALKVLLYNKIKELNSRKNPARINDINWKAPPKI